MLRSKPSPSISSGQPSGARDPVRIDAEAGLHFLPVRVLNASLTTAPVLDIPTRSGSSTPSRRTLRRWTCRTTRRSSSPRLLGIQPNRRRSAGLAGHRAGPDVAGIGRLGAPAPLRRLGAFARVLNRAIWRLNSASHQRPQLAYHLSAGAPPSPKRPIIQSASCLVHQVVTFHAPATTVGSESVDRRIQDENKLTDQNHRRGSRGGHCRAVERLGPTPSRGRHSRRRHHRGCCRRGSGLSRRWGLRICRSATPTAVLCPPPAPAQLRVLSLAPAATILRASLSSAGVPQACAPPVALSR